MKKDEMISAISKRVGLKKEDCAKVFDASFEVITEALLNDDKISIQGFGIFETKVRPAREGIIPKTKEKIWIEESRNASFRASKVLKLALNKKDSE